MLLLIGFIGALLRMRFLLLVGKISSWIFILYAIADVPDPEDLRMTGTQYPSGAYVLVRVVLLSALAIALFICFRRLGKVNHPKPVENAPGDRPSAAN